ncbi:hypothetical protein FGG08_004729 [Glutinoglossum americanum]|uniref:Protein kinase domain-containing protein n=1 Tax=Glutinoglossum americanum TaxID=1670608 RepID=A0A9P8L2G2_9PEZI|nr:hypothetical protein FGG08_004729 [Glutinoglossum americanum]
MAGRVLASGPLEMAEDKPGSLLKQAGSNVEIPTYSDPGQIFQFVETLGSGSFAIVDKVEVISGPHSGGIYAKKSCKVRTDEQAQRFRDEVRLLRKLNNPHITRIIDIYKTDKIPIWYVIVMDPAADMDLEFYLTEMGKTEYKTPEWGFHHGNLEGWYGCLSGALAYLHSQRVWHKDIKPSNILVQGRKVFLADFGISKDLEGKTTTSSAGEPGLRTRKYCAPEVAAGKRRRRTSDLFSLGCVFLEMSTVSRRETLKEFEKFRRTDDDGTYPGNLEKLLKWIAHLDSKASHDLFNRNVLSWCFALLQPDPFKRATAQQVYDDFLKHTRTLCDTCLVSRSEHELQSPYGFIAPVRPLSVESCPTWEVANEEWPYLQ